MPMMQFSAAPWRVLDKKHCDLCFEAAKLHDKFKDYILKLAKDAVNTGEPVVRALEYEFSGEGFENVKDSFMLGDKYLVSPVIVKDQTKKKIKLPGGKWKSDDGTVYDGGCEIEIDTPIERIPYFEKL